MRSVIVSFVALSILSGCANPKVVAERQLGDSDMSCSQIKNEMYEAERFEDEARDEKGVTGTNVAAGLLFWPALLVTYSNVEDAIDAAQDRKKYLLRLADEKKCKF